MKFSRSDLADFTYFLAIARHRSFRRAGLELEVSASALSHSLKGLEARLGIRLLNRTNRSVTLTAAGEALLEEIRDERAPAVRFDPRKAGVRLIGNPNATGTPRRNRRRR